MQEPTEESLLKMSAELILNNAKIVLEDDVISGSVVIRDGRIADISEGSVAGGEDFEGDYLIPGLIELHTDHLEGPLYAASAGALESDCCCPRP